MEECFGSFANAIVDNQASAVQTSAGSQWEHTGCLWTTIFGKLLGLNRLSRLGNLLQSNHEGCLPKKVPAVASF